MGQAQSRPPGPPATDPPHPVGLRRVLGFWEVTAGGVGIIIGAGIYVLIGAATAEAGAAVWLAFVLAGLLSALSGLSYAELAAMFPRASAEYEFTRHAFPRWVAFVVGWVMIAGLVVAAATVSLGFARYLGYFLPVGGRTGAVALLVIVAAVALTGIKESARMMLSLSVIQIGGLLIVIAIGVPHLGEQNLLEATSAGGVFAAAALVFFAFIGFDEVISLSEETRDPTRTIPRALLVALGVSTALYIAVAIAAVSVLGAAALGASERPLADVIDHVTGSGAAGAIAVIALISTTNTTLLALTAASRMMYGMASQGALPASLAAVHPRRQTPVRAIAMAVLVSAGFALIGDLRLVASVTDFAVYFVFLAVNTTVVILRLRAPEQARPLRVPWSIGRVPVLPILGFASVLAMLTQLEARALVLGILVTLTGLAAAFMLRPRLR